MKQKLLFLLVLLLTATTGAWAQTQWTSGSCTVTLSNGTLTFSGKGAMDDYQTPNNRPWNFNTNDVTSVVVESGVTTVGAMSFCNFGKMTSVTLPEGLTSIGTRSFLSCSKLTSVTIPSTVTSIGADAFYSCTSVTNVNLYADPANLTWNEDGCDDFNRDVMGSTKCHVLAEYLSAYETKFSEKINVTFVGDLKPLTPATYSVSLAEGTEDADKWTVKAGEGEAQELPLEGLEGGEKITATYSGDKKVKSVKAVKKETSSFTEVTTFSELQTALSAGKNVKLKNDIVCTEEISITSDGALTIDGNGKKLSTTSEIRAFKVESSATVAFKDLTLTGFVNGGGPAINNSGTIVLDGCTISNCHVNNSNGGGAIESNGKLYAINTTFSGNYSGEIGGAINNYMGSLYMSGCTFTDNYTTRGDAYYGGAIGINGGSEVRLINCAFSGNKYGTNTGTNDIGVYSKPTNYTIAGCTGATIASDDGDITPNTTGTATLDYSDLSNISFTYTAE